ncbi:unnamed protein product [Tuber melanosporum]|jgi:hypothetical protein|uniref:(Perigord truffle) hypothetical protein n=1 Tax=Tuber melanosporum (strain Mel28) TaxID=656061 RepID=D5GLI4_TUBMM|nr:uncharacterized protein GSTUM_00010220001 [Tuber melanosporum]KAG0137151.1 hypothetical protein HOY82DRAFT_403847 [Tuber indicum]CAZ85377.1 unnamed protein product [Tuber melanosporum]
MSPPIYYPATDSITPPGHVPPSFPSLYWPINPNPGEAAYLYIPRDVWKFTLYWTLIVYAAFHLSAGVWAFAMRPSKLSIGVPLFYVVVGGIEATIAGSIVGSILGAVYQAGYFRMSTWIPFVWSVINLLVLLLSSFSMQGGL